MESQKPNFTVFEGNQCVGSGPLAEVAATGKRLVDSGTKTQILIFNDTTGERVDLNFQCAMAELLRQVSLISGPLPSTNRPAGEKPKRPGRPKLGVVSKEVTLLPRHWEWLGRQPGGASVALRKLVEKARHDNRDQDRLREAREAVYHFLTAMAGDLPGYEAALRALFRGDEKKFSQTTEAWPRDIRAYALEIGRRAFEADRATG